MLRIPIRELIKVSTKVISDYLVGKFIIIFDDGELVTDSRHTLLSSFVWDLFRWNNYQGPINMDAHLTSSLNGKPFNSTAHLTLLNNVLWMIYDHTDSEVRVNSDSRSIDEIETELANLRIILRNQAGLISNEIYDVLSVKTLEYAAGVDILDIIEIVEHDEVSKANNALLPTQKSIASTNKRIDTVLETDESLKDNIIVRSFKAKTVNKIQINQIIGPRGAVTDVDGNIFPIPIMYSYAKGIHSLYDSLIESRMASAALENNKEKLQDTEFGNRRVQLYLMPLIRLHQSDCGTKERSTIVVKPTQRDNHGNLVQGYLPNLIGITYTDENGVDRIIDGSEEELIGRAIRIRTPINCQYPDPQGVCSACIGKLSLSAFDRMNLGHYAWIHISEQLTQRVLSTKHVVSSSEVDRMYVDPIYREFINVTPSGYQYKLNADMKPRSPQLLIEYKSVTALNDIFNMDDVRALAASGVSEIYQIAINYPDAIGSNITQIPIGVKGRPAAMTYDLLEYIKEVGYTIDDHHNYVVDLKDWNYDCEAFAVPLKQYDMANYAQDIMRMLESKMEELIDRDQNINIDAFLMEMISLINSKLNINIGVINIVVYAILVISSMENNFAFPKAFTSKGLSVMRNTLKNRSLSGVFMFQAQRDAYLDPTSYIGQNRMPHPGDSLFIPKQLNKNL